MVTGFIRLNGATVGAVANRSEVYDAEGNKTEEFDGSISARGARKAADFVKFCDAFDIPVLTLTNATGFKATVCSEKMMAKSVGELVAAFADATVPKVNVDHRQSLRYSLRGNEQQIYRCRPCICMG